MPAISSAAHRLFDHCEFKRRQPLQLFNRLRRAPGAVGVGAQFDFAAHGLAHRVQARGVVRCADFDLDLPRPNCAIRLANAAASFGLSAEITPL